MIQKKLKHIMYLDANTLYGYAILNFLQKVDSNSEILKSLI